MAPFLVHSRRDRAPVRPARDEHGAPGMPRCPSSTDTSSVSVQLRKPSCFVSRRLPPAPADRNTPLSSISIASGSPIRQALRSSGASGRPERVGGPPGFPIREPHDPRARRGPGGCPTTAYTPCSRPSTPPAHGKSSGGGPGSGRGLSRSGDEARRRGAPGRRDRWDARSAAGWFLGATTWGRFLGSGGTWRRSGGPG